MPVTSQKNMPLTGIANDLGFGGAQLQQQLQDETEEEKRRRLLGISRSTPTQTNPSILTPATTSLFQTLGLGRGSR
jgi:hypothetical protein